MQREAVRQVRRFNRTVTQRIGALDDRFMSRDRPLGEARVLWEIGPDGATVRSLRRRLDLDSGYMSRILRSLEEDGMVRVAPDPADGRVRIARLTEAGLEERTTLDRLSDDLARSFLAPLNESQRTSLLEALATVERLLTAGLLELEVADPRSPDARRCLDAYFEELDGRFDDGFDPDRSIPADADALTEPDGLLVLARLHGEAIGCGALKLHDEEPAEIKRMWVDPAARGLGLGRRILLELEEHARRRDVRTVRLETNRHLTEAVELYRSAGYREVDPFNEEAYAHHWFEKRLDPSSMGSAAARDLDEASRIRWPAHGRHSLVDERFGMDFDLTAGVAVLERTPATLRAMLDGLPSGWVHATEGPGTWSPFDVVGHLIHGERTDWIPRARLILEQGAERPFTPFDRFAHLRESEGESLPRLLEELARLRRENLATLAGWDLTDDHLDSRGEHPELGPVTLRQLLATWVAHDLGHIGQISRVMAKQYRAAVGPWRAYLSVMER